MRVFPASKVQTLYPNGHDPLPWCSKPQRGFPLSLLHASRFACRVGFHMVGLTSRAAIFFSDPRDHRPLFRPVYFSFFLCGF